MRKDKDGNWEFEYDSPEDSEEDEEGAEGGEKPASSKEGGVPAATGSPEAQQSGGGPLTGAESPMHTDDTAAGETLNLVKFKFSKKI